MTGAHTYCEHARRKDVCKVCSPTVFCVHGTRKARCTKCHGSTICKHNTVKYRCTHCKKMPTDYCLHGKRKEICRDCGGSALCAHGKRKSRCSECKKAKAAPPPKHCRAKRLSANQQICADDFTKSLPSYKSQTRNGKRRRYRL